MEAKKYKFCQSCAMPLMLHDQDLRGSEQDGSKSNKFCHFCYKDGQFTQPDITVDEMIKIGMEGFDTTQKNPLFKWFIKKMYPMQVRKLERWR